MKVLTIAVPCYNSQDYMRKCIESLLPGGEDVEILIVDDGSVDETARIADEYQSQYPTIVRTIHQENGGHGEAVNTGIANAEGLFFKVVDSDDWVNTDAYQQILNVLKEVTRGPQTLDVLISNYVYEKQGARHKRVMQYRSALPQGRIFTWSEMEPLSKRQYILMHSVIYRTQLLRECGLKLPAHTFYVDNLYSFQPMAYVRTLYYLDVNFYRYFIGRADQSVNEKVMLGRLDQQLKVNRLMIDCLDTKKVTDKNQRKYMVHALSIIMMVSTVLLLRTKTEENIEKKRALWRYLKETDIWVYHKIRWSLLGGAVNLPGKGGRKITVAGYRLAQRFYGFN